MQRDLDGKAEILERTILELGSELYQLKVTVSKMGESHEQFLAVMKGLKQLLDDKGLITLEDFDAAVELGEVIERFRSSAELAHHNELEKLKKSGN